MRQTDHAVAGLIGSQDIKLNLAGTSSDLYICVTEVCFDSCLSVLFGWLDR